MAASQGVVLAGRSFGLGVYSLAAPEDAAAALGAVGPGVGTDLPSSISRSSGANFFGGVFASYFILVRTNLAPSLVGAEGSSSTLRGAADVVGAGFVLSSPK